MKTMKTRRQLWWRKEESTEKKGWTYCVAGASNYVRYKNKTHISGIFIYCFPKNVAVWPKWTRFDHRHWGDLTLQCRLPYAPYRLRRRLLRTHTNSQIRGEDNQWIQLTRMLIKGPVPTPYSIVQHSFRLTFRRRGMVHEHLIAVHFTRSRCTHTPCLSTWLHLRFSYRMKILPIVVSIVF